MESKLLERISISMHILLWIMVGLSGRRLILSFILTRIGRSVALHHFIKTFKQRESVYAVNG